MLILCALATVFVAWALVGPSIHFMLSMMRETSMGWQIFIAGPVAWFVCLTQSARRQNW